MKIGVISDTHDNVSAIKKVVEKLLNMEVDMVFHCGDIISPFVVKEFKPIGKILNITFGNNDGDVFTLTNRLSSIGAKIYNTPSIIEIEDRVIFFMHGFNGVDLTKKIVYSMAKSNDYDIILYGHTHFAEIKTINDTLIINPGEVSGYLTGRRTYAIFDLKEKRAEILEF